MAEVDNRFVEMVEAWVPTDATVAVPGDLATIWSGPSVRVTTAELDPALMRASGADYLLLPNVAPELLRCLDAALPLVAFGPCGGRVYALKEIPLRRPEKTPRVVALLAASNEERFIDHCLEHLISQGLEVYLMDHGSTDATPEKARRWLGRGLIGLETPSFDGYFNLGAQLKHKERLAARLDADWFVHVDCDEIHLPPVAGLTLAEALGAVGAAGYNAVDFTEYTFVPTCEAPDHDHPGYWRTMHHYYPFRPASPWAVRAWRRQSVPVDLVKSGGHRLRFPGIRLYPGAFAMKHYQFLSIPQARRKYGGRKYDQTELSKGWHGGIGGWRDAFASMRVILPRQDTLKVFHDDESLDAANPRSRHILAEMVGR